MSLAPGTRLGPYEVLAPLGAGGMGEVYRARDTRLGRDVAIKVLTDHLAGDAKALAHFESEAKAVAALSHPNILALHDVGETGGIRYAVTELLEGETLRSVVTRGALPVKRALEIAAQVASALAAAHEKGIVHRDVKPEHVFLRKDGHAKVLDFGLARRGPGIGSGSDTRSPTEAAVTETGAIVGDLGFDGLRCQPRRPRPRPIGRLGRRLGRGVVAVGQGGLVRGRQDLGLVRSPRRRPRGPAAHAPADPRSLRAPGRPPRRSRPPRRGVVQERELGDAAGGDRGPERLLVRRDGRPGNRGRRLRHAPLRDLPRRGRRGVRLP
ncbi:serine/threonine protein kinase, partial [Acidobacteria bacterium ACD]|nr:serine/threonine protein kinase [Acidobacteria bacterium ACD]